METIKVNEKVFRPSDLANDFQVIEKGEDVFQILHQDKTYKVVVLQHDSDKKNLELLINGNTYKVGVEDEYDLLLKSLGMGAGASRKIKHLKAPMPGLVLDIMVSPGQNVEKDEPLMILEAMKMENILKSPGEGIVKSIEISNGLAVEKNQVLINFE